MLVDMVYYMMMHSMGEASGAEASMSKRVVMDFDNTLGVRGCDVDDGLALLALLGTDDVQVEAVCTCYGNSDIDTVTRNTERMFAELGIEIPIYRGCAGPDAPKSDAAQFLAEVAAANPGEISVLATGSMTNLKGAALIDEGFYANVREVACMGGVTRSLVITPGRIMDELNFSCDAEATLGLLAAPCPTTIATAQNCLPAFFRRDDLAREFGAESWLCRTVDYWFGDMDAAYAWDGWTCWDLVAAFAVARPHLFEQHTMEVTLNRRFLEAGYLEQAAEGAPTATVSVPAIADADAFRAEAYEAWRAAFARLGIL